MVDFNPILIINQKTEEDYMGDSLTISIWRRKLIENSTKSSVMHSYLVV